LGDVRLSEGEIAELDKGLARRRRLGLEWLRRKAGTDRGQDRRKAYITNARVAIDLVPALKRVVAKESRQN
jgi:hypothetical protein